jgi:hypothetical protein
MELDAPGVPKAEGLRADVAARKLDRSGRNAGRVLVPLEGAETARKRCEDGIVRGGVGQLDGDPADLLLGSGCDLATGREREELRAEADAKGGNGGREGVLEVGDLPNQPGMHVLLVRMHGAAEAHDRGVRLGRPRRLLAPVEAHLRHVRS